MRYSIKTQLAYERVEQAGINRSKEGYTEKVLIKETVLEGY